MHIPSDPIENEPHAFRCTSGLAVKYSHVTLSHHTTYMNALAFCYQQEGLACESTTIPKHGVVLEQLGVAGGGTPPLHELGNEQRDAAATGDHQRLPDKVKGQKETGI